MPRPQHLRVQACTTGVRTPVNGQDQHMWSLSSSTPSLVQVFLCTFLLSSRSEREMLICYVLDELLNEFLYVALLPCLENLLSTVIYYAALETHLNVPDRVF